MQFTTETNLFLFTLLKTQKDVPYHRFGDACPICGGYQVVVSGGRDMRVVDIKATTPEDSDKTDS